MNVDFIGGHGAQPRLNRVRHIPEIREKTNAGGLAHVADAPDRDIDTARQGRTIARLIDGMDVLVSGRATPIPETGLQIGVDVEVRGNRIGRRHENKHRTFQRFGQ